MSCKSVRTWSSLIALFSVNLALGQFRVDPAVVREARAAVKARQGHSLMANPLADGTTDLGIAALGPGVRILEEGGVSRAVDLYTGIQTSGNFFWRWTSGSAETAYWALDDGTMGPAGELAGGGHITAYEFSLGLHADFNGDVVRPYVIVSFYNAPADPVASATNPVVEPPAPVSSIAWIFNSITLPSGPGFYNFRSGLIDLASLGLDFDIDDDYYVEVLPLEWSSYPAGNAVVDPDVHAIFANSAAMLTYGSNQNRMWSDFWTRNAGCTVVSSDGDGFYDHPGEMDSCNSGTFLNQSAIRLRGDPCSTVNALKLGIDSPADICVQPGEPVTVTLSQTCLPGLVRGYQAFLQFDTARLTFGSGAYVTPMPYGLPIIVPISAVGADIDLAAGINDLGGQVPTSSSADLVTMNFTAGATEGLTQVTFRLHDPPSRFSDPFGGPVSPTLVDSPVICVDGTAPLMTCAPLSYQCISEIPAPAADYAEFVLHGGSAVDNGCFGPVAPTVTYIGSSDNGGPGCAGMPYVLNRTYRATDCAGNIADCTQVITVVDDTDPTVTAGSIASCYPNTGAAEAAAIAATTSSDNCTPTGSLVVSASTVGTCSAIVTVTVSDACGNASSVNYNTRIDDTIPGIGGSIAGGSLDASCGATIPVSVTVTDNCGVLASAVSFSMSTTSGSIDDSGLVKTQVNAATVTIAGNALLTSVAACSASVSISVSATDECGNPSTAFSVSGLWSDASAPIVNAGPDPAPYPADAGGCTALVSWAAATATDNCPSVLSTVYDIDEGNNGSNEVTGQSGTSHTFPVGTHRVTARVSDGCGNEGSDFFLVTILPVNELVVDVELNWQFAGTRCITFELWNCPGSTPSATVTAELVFSYSGFDNGKAENQIVLVPCAAGPYDCITARDRLHTLRQTDETPTIVGTQYDISFTGADKLRGGNLNDDYWIDILDFGVYSFKYGKRYRDGVEVLATDPPFDGDTFCTPPTLPPHADISGNGFVFTEDFTFIQQAYLTHHEANCCGQAGLQGPGGRFIAAAEGAEGPVISIAVAELQARGLGELAVADLNDDGVLDSLDMIAFIAGSRPTDDVDRPLLDTPTSLLVPTGARPIPRRP